MTLLYQLGVTLYHFAIRVAASFGNSQARKWVAGRKAPSLPPSILLPPLTGNRIWMHCASLGEWEQGRPVLEAIRKAHPDWTAVLTFFSPSGYERCKDTEVVDHVAYLPADGPKRATDWVARLQPTVAIFVKYELWFFHLRALHQAGVPTFLIAASFRPGQRFFQERGGGWWREMLGFFTGIITQTEKDMALLIGPGKYPAERAVVGGDPRMDRTLELAATPFSDPIIEEFTAHGLTIVAGSVWPEDLRVLWGFWDELPDNVRIILAPHQLHEHTLARTQEQWAAQRYTQTFPELVIDSRVLLLDTIGILSRVYRYGDIAYVGGGFKTGLHNTLEPLAYGLPTLFGPKHQKFPEAAAALARGGAFSASSANLLQVEVEALLDPERRKRASSAQLALAQEHAGAGARTARLVLERLHQLILPLLLCILTCTCVRAQSGMTDTERLSGSFTNAFEKGNLMAALSGVEWRPGISLAAAIVPTGQTIGLALELQPNVNYAILASAESEAYDVDLLLRGPTGDVLVEDLSEDGTPILEFQVPSGGSYQIQLHAVSGPTERSFLTVCLLRGGGSSILETNYRRITDVFFSTCRRLLTDLPGMRWQPTPSQWCLYGLSLPPRGGLTLRNLKPGPGQRTFALGASQSIENIDLYLANRDQQIVAWDISQGSSPLLSYDCSLAPPFDLRIELDRGRPADLLLLGVFEN